jgi:hypothetical protein
MNSLIAYIPLRFPQERTTGKIENYGEHYAFKCCTLNKEQIDGLTCMAC